MAFLADADQLPLSGVRVCDAQGQVRPVPQVLDVVDDPGRPVPVALLPAEHTLPLVQPEHILPKRLPLRPAVKQVFPACLDEAEQLVEPGR